MAARISGDASRAERAVTLCETTLSFPIQYPYGKTVARLGLALLAVQQGNMEAAKEQYAALESGPGIMLLYISTDRVLGLLSLTQGHMDRAMAHFEDALAFCRKAGYRPELAWTCCDYADGLLQRSSPGDRERATSLLDESLAISIESGMRPLMQRVAARQATVDSRPAAAPAYPDRLTRREVEVLRLIAAGKSNQQIADELVLSIRTVERHVTNSYRKINARSRADATAYALRHNLAN